MFKLWLCYRFCHCHLAGQSIHMNQIWRVLPDCEELMIGHLLDRKSYLPVILLQCRFMKIIVEIHNFCNLDFHMLLGLTSSTHHCICNLFMVKIALWDSLLSKQSYSILMNFKFVLNLKLYWVFQIIHYLLILSK